MDETPINVEVAFQYTEEYKESLGKTYNKKEKKDDKLPFEISEFT